MNRPADAPCTYALHNEGYMMPCASGHNQDHEQAVALMNAWDRYGEQIERTPVILPTATLDFLRSEEFRLLLEKAFAKSHSIFVTGGTHGSWDGSNGGIARNHAYSADRIMEMIEDVIGRA